MARKNHSEEAGAMYDIYWDSVNAGGNVAHMWQKMYDTSISMKFAKLKGMQKAYADLSSKDSELLAEINAELKLSGSIVTKEITFLYKDRLKVLKNKSKLARKIHEEKSSIIKTGDVDD